MQAASPLQRTGGGTARAALGFEGGASPEPEDGSVHTSAELHPRSFQLVRSGSTDSLASMVRSAAFFLQSSPFWGASCQAPVQEQAPLAAWPAWCKQLQSRRAASCASSRQAPAQEQAACGGPAVLPLCQEGLQ